MTKPLGPNIIEWPETGHPQPSDLADLAPVPDGSNNPVEELQDDIDLIIATDLANAPRSKKTTIGPSELGHECSRWIGYKQLGTQVLNPQPIAWRPAVGTGVHALLEGAFHRANTYVGSTRFLVEQKVTVGEVLGEPITGSCDLVDRVNATTVDWKIVGPTTLRKVKSAGSPSDRYRIQAHAYARGFNRAGVRVNRVSVYYLPSNGEYYEGHLWHEPYDEQIVLNALSRVEAITTLVKNVGTTGLTLLPTADAYCGRCPYFRAGSTDLAQGCPGDPAVTNRWTANINSLIA
ncbi:hypothetical protein ACIBH1_05600 [Nonomuraea sp. NPDC050663]|uniref:hypothetical protein n=1 Tax=Nonomuraea sp. NPDC050663 TaxID=3364370 RepID=UPI0037B934D8